MSQRKRLREREVVAGLGILQFILIIIVIVIVELWVQTLILFISPFEVLLLLGISLVLLTILAGWSGRK